MINSVRLSWKVESIPQYLLLFFLFIAISCFIVYTYIYLAQTVSQTALSSWRSLRAGIFPRRWKIQVCFLTKTRQAAGGSRQSLGAMHMPDAPGGHRSQGNHRTHEHASGDPQGFVAGPTLWNAMYDGLLILEHSDCTRIRGRHYNGGGRQNYRGSWGFRLCYNNKGQWLACLCGLSLAPDIE